jgi:uncharacterized protein with ATP-grasp and redox domains
MTPFMDITPECVPCLMGRVIFQARLAGNGSEFKAVRAAAGSFSEEFAEGRNSAAVATEVHRSAYRAMGVRDPYLGLKKRADAVASGYIGRAERFISDSDDRIRAAALMAVIGNIMDFGSGIAIDYPEEFAGQFERMVAQGIGSDDTDEMRKMIKPGSVVIYILDNCGESLFDALLIREIQALGARVVGVVRGEPILNDITMDDAVRAGIDSVPDRMLTTGQFAIGLDLDRIGDDLRDELSVADLIVAKGMANYESLSDQAVGIPTVYMLRSKCRPVASSLGVPEDISVVRLVK